MAENKRTILLTGANDGLGRAIVSQIVATPELRAYHGLYTAREASTATALRSELHNPHHSHDILSFDLARLSQGRELAAAINARVASGEIPQIRALILNAGFQEFTNQTWTDDDYDMSFATNYLGHWLLTLLLLQSMDRDFGRVIVIGSLAHDSSATQNRFSGFSDVKWKTMLCDGLTEPVARGTWSMTKDDPSWHAGFRRYAASKLCAVMMIDELQRRLDVNSDLKNISVLGVDPDTMPTSLVRRGPWMTRVFIFQIMMPLIITLSAWLVPNGPWRTIKKSAKDVLAAAFEAGPPLSGRPKGLYLDGSRIGQESAEAKDVEKQRLLWRDTVGYAQLKDGETILQF